MVMNQLIIDVTTDCMLRCVHCSQSVHKYNKVMLDMGVYRKVIDEISHLSIKPKHIRMAAVGEPLLHPNLYNMITYAVNNTKSKVTLTTNGMLLHPGIIHTGLAMIDISIDAASEATYNKIRRGGDYNKVVSNVNAVIQNKGDTKVYVSFVLQPSNKHEEQAFRQKWYGKADGVIVRRLHTFGGTVGGCVVAVERFPCYYPFERLVLTPWGRYAYCPVLGGRQDNYLDARKLTLQQAWESDYLQKIRAAHMSNDFTDAPYCRDCPDWQQTRWPGKGETYMDIINKI